MQGLMSQVRPSIVLLRLFSLESFGSHSLYSTHHVGGNHYNNDENAKIAVPSWLSEQTASFYEDDICNVILRYDTFLTNLTAVVTDKENYVESENKYEF